MKLRYFSILPLLLGMGAVVAAELAIPQVLPESMARQLLANDPALATAESAYASADIEAQQQRLSPYDWVAKGQVQRRDYRAGTGNASGANSTEWNVGIERTVRLPAKIRADHASSSAAMTLAQRQAQLSRRQVTADLLDAWFGWVAADAHKALLLRQQTAVADNAAVVAKRVKAGEAAQLEHQLASAELSTLQRQVSEATYQAQTAWTVLATRYQATAQFKLERVPDPIPVPYDAVWWQTRLLEVNDTLALTRAQVTAAAAQVQRAQADRQPDPTFGVFTASEAYGHERIIGISASLPLGGKRRSLEVERLQAQENSARLNLALIEREQRAASLGDYRAATGAYERWQLAQQTATLMADNARLTQKAYALGEGDVQQLLQARRQSLAAYDEEASAKVAALRAYYQLLLHAKLLWGDGLDR